jgi:hypothetical protein
VDRVARLVGACPHPARADGDAVLKRRAAAMGFRAPVDLTPPPPGPRADGS